MIGNLVTVSRFNEFEYSFTLHSTLFYESILYTIWLDRASPLEALTFIFGNSSKQYITMTSLPEQEESKPLNSFRVKEDRFMAVSQSCPDRIYLELRVPVVIASVQRIIFKVRSHDQGNMKKYTL